MLDSLKFILIGIIIALIIYAFVKFKVARIFIITAVIFVVVFSGIVSGFRLNTYYNAKGGIIGQITGIYKEENNVIVTESTSIDFELKNVSLTKNENGKYSAKFSTEKTLKLQDNEFYQILVNGEPAQLIYSDKSSAVANYTYLFQSEEFLKDNYKEIAVDTMKIAFGFYGNYSNIICEIDGGSETAPLWQAFFEKNNLKITIVKVNQLAISENSELKTITIYANDEVIDIVKIKKDSEFVLPETFEVDGYKFNGFEVDGKIETKIIVTKDMTVTANLEKLYTVTLYKNSPNSSGTNLDIISQQQITSSEKLELDNPTHKDFEFLGWSIDKETVLDLETFRVTEDTILYAVWDLTSRPVNIILNGSNASVNINSEVITENKTIFVDYAEEIIIQDYQRENYKLSNIIIFYHNNFCEITNFEESKTYEYYYKLLAYNTEYNPDDETEFAYETMTIHFSWLEDNNNVLDLENKILKRFGMTELLTELPEEEFLEILYYGLTKDEVDYTVSEYRSKLASIYNIEYEENCTFEEFLTIFYNEATIYKISYELNGGSFTGTYTYSSYYNNIIEISAPERTGYVFDGWEITGLTENVKFYGTSAGELVEVSASESTIILYENTTYFFKRLNNNSGTVTFKALWYEPSAGGR